MFVKLQEAVFLWMTAGPVQFLSTLHHYHAKYGKQIRRRQLHRSELN